MLTFESFDIEADTSCSYDYVQVLFGSYEQKYCGSNVPSPIISSENWMTVIFHSDDSKALIGFKATWKAVETGMLFGLKYLLWSDIYWGIHYIIQPTKILTSDCQVEASYKAIAVFGCIPPTTLTLISCFSAPCDQI